MKNSNTETSKFLSYILRHEPESIGLSIDNEGWANINELIESANTSNHFISLDKILEIMEKDSKQRFAISIDGQYIRANQGHSLNTIALKYNEISPPELLFHGTATRFIDDIRKLGLVAMNRQFVHLTESKDSALQVGKRYGKPVLLTIHTQKMSDKGFKFYHTENNIWLTKSVPTEYIDFQS